MFSLQNSLQNVRHVCAQQIRHIQVCVLGAETETGQMLSLLLKQNPVISGLHLQGISKVDEMAEDLNHFDTRCEVKSYSKLDSVSKSVKSADIVVMLELSQSVCAQELSPSQNIMSNGPRLMKLAATCAKYAPKAVTVVAVTPISVMMPLVEKVYKSTDWYNPARILGAVTSFQIKANALVGHYQTLNPSNVYVPIIGGPDIDNAIPVFSQSQPVELSPDDAKKLLKHFREEPSKKSSCQAVGLNRMITAIALGLSGETNSKANTLAFVRSNIVGSCRHIVSVVKIGKSGVVHNYGLQKLSNTELNKFEEVCLTLKDKEKIASDLAHLNDEKTLPSFMIEELEEDKIAKSGIIR